MLVVISYDIQTKDKKGAKRLRKVAKTCQNHGQRVQYSVFECLVDPAQWVSLKNQLLDIINEEEDSLRFYYLGANYQTRIEHVGAKEGYDPEGPLVI
jgi:CRISPR-associated protein Cas2